MFFSQIRGASNPWEIKCHFDFIFYKNLLVETFRSDEKCFGQTEHIRLLVRLTDRTLNNLAQTVTGVWFDRFFFRQGMVRHVGKQLFGLIGFCQTYDW